MSEEESIRFIGETCMAARSLRIYGRFQEDYFVWFDPGNMRFTWKTEPGKDKREILLKACNSLINYLNPCQNSQKK